MEENEIQQRLRSYDFYNERNGLSVWARTPRAFKWINGGGSIGITLLSLPFLLYYDRMASPHSTSMVYDDVGRPRVILDSL